jgi:hypothetical protein
MNLEDVFVEPVLVKVEIDDEETVAEYNGSLVFYTPDRQPLNVFIKLSSSLGKNQDESINLLQGLVLKQDGSPIYVGNRMPKPALGVKILAKVMELLGK